MRIARLTILLALLSIIPLEPVRALASPSPSTLANGDGNQADAAASSGPGFMKQTYNLNGSGTASVEMGDVTGDGRNDALITVGTNNLHVNLMVLAQQPDGSLGSPVKYATDDNLSQPGNRGIAVGDLN